MIARAYGAECPEEEWLWKFPRNPDGWFGVVAESEQGQIVGNFAGWPMRFVLDEVERTVDRIVWYAGWADKLAQVIGSSNPVAGPYFNFTVPEPTGVVAVVAPDEPPLLGLVSRVLPALTGGNAVVAVASETHPLAAIELAEALATSDVPGGAVNLLTGRRDELAPWLASHMDVNAIDVTGADGGSADLERAAADNVKRVVHGNPDTQSPWEIASFLELKTVWHPVGQ